VIEEIRKRTDERAEPECVSDIPIILEIYSTRVPNLQVKALSLNFIDVFQAAFTRADSKCKKKHSSLYCLLGFLGPAHVKSCLY